MIYGRELPGYPFNAQALLTRGIVYTQRKFFCHWFKRLSDHVGADVDTSRDETQSRIAHAIDTRKPLLVTRFGSYEMEATLRGLDIKDPIPRIRKFLGLFSGRNGPFWWDNSIRGGLCWNAGFFPADNRSMQGYSDRVVEDAHQIDLLATWNGPGEKRLKKQFFPDARICSFGSIEPFFAREPWTLALAGKKVLVISPFADSITRQYTKREMLFSGNDKILPAFELITYRSVSSFMGNVTPYVSWFEALETMCNDIRSIDFDVAIIGCGAYGMDIGAFVKRDLGKVAIHLGGVTQILFGVIGKRWETYGVSKYFNEHWIRPVPSDTVKNTSTVEGGCYW